LALQVLQGQREEQVLQDLLDLELQVLQGQREERVLLDLELQALLEFKVSRDPQVVLVLLVWESQDPLDLERQDIREKQGLLDLLVILDHQVIRVLEDKPQIPAQRVQREEQVLLAQQESQEQLQIPVQ
jgi:hypothetical protein